MRFSTVLVSSVFVLAGTSAALPRENENILVARFADSDVIAEVDSRAYDEEPELYVQGGATSRYRRSEYDNDLVARGYVFSKGDGDSTSLHYRRSFYKPSRYELSRRYRHSDRRIPNNRYSPGSRPSIPGSRPSAPGSSITSTRANPPVRDWRTIPSTSYSPLHNGGEASSTPSSSRPSTPNIATVPSDNRPSSPEGWRRVPDGSGSHHRRSFYDLD